MAAEHVLALFLVFLFLSMFMCITSDMVYFQVLQIRALRCRDRHNGKSTSYCYEKCPYSFDCPYWRKITFKERIKLYFKK